MAQQVISASNANLDDLPFRALLNGEPLVIRNAGFVTIDSEPQWSLQNAYLGNLHVEDGTLRIDGTKIREIRYDSATGVIPLGGFVSGNTGGATGEIVRVVSQSATEGIIKLRSIASGAAAFVGSEVLSIYSASADTGVTATAATPDSQSILWIIGAEGSNISVARPGTFIVTGSWYDLGISNGTSNQTFFHPSGVMTPLPAVWVETASGSNEFFPWLHPGTSTNVGSPNQFKVAGNNIRGHFISQSYTLFGGNFASASNWPLSFSFGNGVSGSIPPSQSRIVIPNVIMSTTTPIAWSGSRTTVNATLATRWETVVTSSGVIEMDKVLAPGVYLSLAQPYQVTLRDVGTFNQIVVSECPNVCLFDGVGVGTFASQSNLPALNITTNQDTRIYRSAFTINATTNNSWCHQFNTSNNIILSRSLFHTIGQARAAAHYLLYLNTCTNVTMSHCDLVGGPVAIATTDTALIANTTFSYSPTGSDQSTVAANAYVLTAGSKNITFSEMTCSGDWNRNEFFSITNCTNIKIRNFGTFDRPLILRNQVNTIANFANNNQFLEIARVYATQSRVSAASYITTTNSNTKFTIQNVMSDQNDGWNNTTLNTLARGIRMGNGALGGTSGITTALTAVYGCHFYDFFNGQSGSINQHMSGGLAILMTELTDYTAGSYAVTTGSVKFNSLGGVVIPSASSEIEWTWPWYLKGHVQFASQSASITGTNIGNFNYFYSIDSGSGVYGPFKSMSLANLLAESWSQDPGIKVKVRAKCVTSNDTNALTGLIIYTSSSFDAQRNAVYPLDSVNATLSLTGLQSGSEVRVYRSDNGAELAGVESTVGSTFEYNYVWEGTNIDADIVIHALNYEYIRYTNITLGSSGVSIPVQQRFDRNYSNP